MFSGIINYIGLVTKKKSNSLYIEINFKGKNITIGDSVAINGVCLTLSEYVGQVYKFDVSQETLRVTNLSLLDVGSEVNVELPLTLSDFVNGGLVSGHVDNLVKVKNIEKFGEFTVFRIFFGKSFGNFLYKKGSVTLDGVNLTINNLNLAQETFEIMVIPHTLANTIIKNWQIDTLVNMEIDILVRYCHKNTENY